MKTRYKFLIILILFSLIEGVVFGQKSGEEIHQRNVSVVTVYFDYPVRIVGLAPHDKWEEITDSHMSFRFTQKDTRPHHIMVQEIRDCKYYVLYVYPEFHMDCKKRTYMQFNKGDLEWLESIPPIKTPDW